MLMLMNFSNLALLTTLVDIKTFKAPNHCLCAF